MKQVAVVIWILGSCFLGSCSKQPQPVRHLSEKAVPDSALMAQMEFNSQMAHAADRACSDWVKGDSANYAIDEFGFWYTKIQNSHTDTLQKGDKVLTRIRMSELDGTLLADIEDYFIIGAGNLPIAINRSLKQMGRGEEMRIVAPWYTMYGAEGTTLVKPYSNLIIILTTTEE